MAPSQVTVDGHYTINELGRRILAALEAVGKDVDSLTVDDLAPIDEFHIRGRTSTEELAQLAEIRPNELVLDAGCGIGGTSRYLATSVGCRVVGVDLTEEYCRVAEMLSERVGLADHTTFRQGSVLDLPFPDGEFDVVWTEHVQMNIADKVGFYGELGRVLKLGGRFAFHDVFAGENPDLRYPVPWAAEPSISHLAGVDELKAILSELGFVEAHWEDKTGESAAFFEKLLVRVRSVGLPPVGIHLLMGDDAEAKLENSHLNFADDCVRVIQAVLVRPE